MLTFYLKLNLSCFSASTSLATAPILAPIAIPVADTSSGISQDSGPDAHPDVTADATAASMAVQSVDPPFDADLLAGPSLSSATNSMARRRHSMEIPSVSNISNDRRFSLGM